MNYYNDIDPFACAWMKELIKEGLVPDGQIDSRSIADVQPADLRGFAQCHFFGGVLGWPLALRLAGWPEDRPVWSGSAPCQPFSSAGKRKGTSDERHLWPHFYRLIRECRPPTVFGEQVASSEVVGSQLEAAFLVAVQKGDYARANKLAKRLAQSHGFHYWARWVDSVQADLAAVGYSFGFKILGAHSVGADHIRQRLYWVADAEDSGCSRGEAGNQGRPQCSIQSGGQGDRGQRRIESIGCRAVDRLAHAERDGGRRDEPQRGAEGRTADGRAGAGAGGLCHPSGEGLAQWKDADAAAQCPTVEQPGGNGFWSDYRVVYCRDGKYRRVPAQSLLQPLASGVPNRVGLLRGAGNSIVPQVAAEFVRAYMETMTELEAAHA